MNSINAEKPKKVIPWLTVSILIVLVVVIAVSFLRDSEAGRKNADDLIAASVAIMRHPIRSLAFAVFTPLGFWVFHHGFAGGGFGRQKSRIWGSVVVGGSLVVIGLIALLGIR